MTEHSHGGSACKWCGVDYDFDLPEVITEACARGDLVIFAGAGVSTEVPAVFPVTLYSSLRARISTDAESFPAVMEEFQESHDRTTLVKEIRSRLMYADSFPTARRAARQFHVELATIFQIRDIITTNWDTYFEEECLANPFVIGEDVAFAGLHERRVFKLHGSMNNLASLVITESDYVEALERLGSNLMGAHVRNLLASKVVVFVGYSLDDWNFRRLYTALRQDLGKFAPPAYVVSPFDAPNAFDLKLTHLRTSGVKFAQDLKASLTGECILPDSSYDAIASLEQRALRADDLIKAVDHEKYPAVAYSWFYSDGVLDACFRIQNRRGSGEYSDAHRVQWQMHQYGRAAMRAFKAGRFQDAAYMEGYANVLVALMCSEDDDLYDEFNYFYLSGIEEDITNPEEFRMRLEESRRRAPRQRAAARKILENLPDGMVLEHDRTLPDLFDGHESGEPHSH